MTPSRISRAVVAGRKAGPLRKTADHRNRRVHFHREIGPEELYEICRDHPGEAEAALEGMVRRLKDDEGGLDGKI